MKLSSTNLRGFDSRHENFIFDFAKKQDVVLVQETLLSDPDRISRLSSGWLGPSFWSLAVGKQGGIAVLINENFPGKIGSWRRDSDGRILGLPIDLDNIKLNLVNIYAPGNLTEHKTFSSLSMNFSYQPIVLF